MTPAPATPGDASRPAARRLLRSSRSRQLHRTSAETRARSSGAVGKREGKASGSGRFVSESFPADNWGCGRSSEGVVGAHRIKDENPRIFWFENSFSVEDTVRLEITLSVEQVAFGGQGLGRLPDGKVCFFPGVIPGERVQVRIRRQRASYAEADLVKILEASPDRVKPPCPVYGRCGGCQYQHVKY